MREEMEKPLNAAKSFKHHSNLGSSDMRSIMSRRAGQKGRWKGLKATDAEHGFNEHEAEKDLTAHGLRMDTQPAGQTENQGRSLSPRPSPHTQDTKGGAGGLGQPQREKHVGQRDDTQPDSPVAWESELPPDSRCPMTQQAKVSRHNQPCLGPTEPGRTL